MVQRHAAQYVLSKFDWYASVSLDMISLLGWSTLESIRNTLRTLVMHKIINNLVDAPIQCCYRQLYSILRNYNNNPVGSMLMHTLFSSSNQIMEQLITPALGGCKPSKREYIIYVDYYYLLITHIYTCMTILMSAESVHYQINE